MRDNFSRTEILLGSEAIDRLQKSKVAVFGIGGVGGYAAESLVRAGIGNLDVFDGDVVSESNLNRQIVATVSAIGMAKTEVFKSRAKDINPEININGYPVFYTKDNAHEFDLSQYDYIVDAIDMVSAKVELIKRASEANIPIISCMGAGNKLDPKGFEVTDIYKTNVCPLARVMRRELKNAGVKSLKVVYSKEQLPLEMLSLNGDSTNDDNIEPKQFDSVTEEFGQKRKVNRQPVGSLVTVVATAGLLLANEVIMDIINDN